MGLPSLPTAPSTWCHQVSRCAHVQLQDLKVQCHLSNPKSNHRSDEETETQKEKVTFHRVSGSSGQPLVYYFSSEITWLRTQLEPECPRGPLECKSVLPDGQEGQRTFPEPGCGPTQTPGIAHTAGGLGFNKLAINSNLLHPCGMENKTNHFIRERQA